MQEISRYITVECVLNEKKELIPFWDSSIEYEKSEDYGKRVRIAGSIFKDYSSNWVMGLFDLRDKSLSPGIELECYPNTTDYTVGQKVYVEVEGYSRALQETFITEIVYLDYEVRIQKGKKIEKWYLQNYLAFENLVLDREALYCMKLWKPAYKLANDALVEHDYRLHKVYEELLKD